MPRKHLAALTACVALLLAAVPAMADEKDQSAKKPLGTWKRKADETTIVLTVTDKAINVRIKSDKLDLGFDADYAISGKNGLYACIRKVKEGDDKLTGELFGFAFEAGDKELDLSKFKGTGLVALGGFFMNGTYKKEESK